MCLHTRLLVFEFIQGRKGIYDQSDLYIKEILWPSGTVLFRYQYMACLSSITYLKKSNHHSKEIVPCVRSELGKNVLQCLIDIQKLTGTLQTYLLFLEFMALVNEFVRHTRSFCNNIIKEYLYYYVILLLISHSIIVLILHSINNISFILLHFEFKFIKIN